MSGNQFIPKTQRQEDFARVESAEKNDTIASFLYSGAQWTVVLLFVFVPIFFTPGIWATLGFDKVLLVLVFESLAVILMALLSLRRASVQTVLPLSLGLFWMTAFAAYASGIISGDTQDALRGSVLETQTAGFLVLMSLTATVPLILQGSKKMTIRTMVALAGAAALLLLYTAARLVFGAEIFSLGTFTKATLSPIGTFNDLAIFSGLVVLLSLVALVQLPLRKQIQWGLFSLVVLALFVLAGVNFFNIWLVIGFFSLLMLMYLLSRDMVFPGRKSTSLANSKILIATLALVCVVSAVFIVVGDYAGKKVAQFTNVDYVEVRPSIEATIGVATAVYENNALFGIGANRFSDAWRQYKDQNINNTIFWDTDFTAGSGFVPTLFVNIGLLGGVLLIAFHLGLLYVGYRILIRPTNTDPYWYYYGVATFTATCFLWGMAYVYVPGVTILLLTALFTGSAFVAAAAIEPRMNKTILLLANRQRGFVLMMLIVLVVAISIASLYTIGAQYSAQAKFNKAQATATSPAALEEVAVRAYEQYPDVRFLSARAQLQQLTLTSLLEVKDPTEEQQKSFLNAAEIALSAAEEAVQKDSSDPRNHALLASIFSNLASVGIDGAGKRAASALAEAQRLDPQNPGYSLFFAQIALRAGDIETARQELARSLEHKRDFTPAMYLSAQLDISEGKTESAIATTRSIIMLEPRNPTRYFQLGVLLAATDQLPEAVAAYRAAIVLDPQYANARYLLALAHLKMGEAGEALSQLKVVLETNQDNQQLRDLIAQVESGQYQVPAEQGLETLVSEQVGGEANEGSITTNDVDSDLVTPVNTISEGEEDVMIDTSVALPTGEQQDESVSNVTDVAPTE